MDDRDRSRLGIMRDAEFIRKFLIGLGLGSWADRRFGTSIFVLIGVFLGAGATIKVRRDT